MLSRLSRLATVSGAFGLVYLAISIAQFKHTAWAGSYVFEGLPPAAAAPFLEHLLWTLNGYLLAVTIDVGMFVSAHQLSRKRSWILLGAFFIAAAVSAYTQLLYTAHNSATFAFSSGVTSYWQTTLKSLMDARVVILPLALPLFAIIYTLARMNIHSQAEREHPKTEPINIQPVSHPSVVVAMDTAPKQLSPPKPLSLQGEIRGGTKKAEIVLIDEIQVPAGESREDAKRRRARERRKRQNAQNRNP